MIEVNLIPDVKQQLLRAQNVRSNVISASIVIGLATLGVIALLSVYVFLIQTIRHAIVDEGIKKENAKLAAVDDLSKMLTIQNQLTKIPTLNDNKKMDSRVFDMLAAVTPVKQDQVQISSLTINAETSTIALEGQASNGYAALEVFKKSIAAAVIRFTDTQQSSQEVTLASDISTSNISYGEDSTGRKVLRFNLRFVYAPELFSPSSTNLSVVIVGEGNVTDSYLGVPRSLFADRAEDI